MSAHPKMLQIRSEIEAEVEPLEGATLKQWQEWTVRAVRAAEKADLTLTRRANEAGKGLWTVREMFRARRAELKKEGKKLKSEMTWTRWYEAEKLSTATIKSYIGVYAKCIEEPALLNEPLSYFASVPDLPRESSDDEPIEIGAVRWVRGREKVGADWYLNRGDQVQLESATADGEHRWKVLTGKHKGKGFYKGPLDLSETPIELPTPHRDKAEPIDHRSTNQAPKKLVEDKSALAAKRVEGGTATAVEPATVVTDQTREQPALTVVQDHEEEEGEEETCVPQEVWDAVETLQGVAKGIASWELSDESRSILREAAQKFVTQLD